MLFRSPIPDYVILAGYITGGVARGALVGIVVTCVAMLFTPLRVHHLGIMVAVVLLTATLFSLAGLVNGIYAKKFDDISIIPTFILTPLIYLGGVFYSISLLPELWQGISRFNPILYMVNTFRYSLLGVSDINLALAFALIILFIVLDRKSTRLNSSHPSRSRMPSSA